MQSNFLHGSPIYLLGNNCELANERTGNLFMLFSFFSIWQVKLATIYCFSFNKCELAIFAHVLPFFTNNFFIGSSYIEFVIFMRFEIRCMNILFDVIPHLQISDLGPLFLFR